MAALTYKMTTTVPTSQAAVLIKQINACLLFENNWNIVSAQWFPLVAQW